jgi:hypothetical protein
MTHFVRGLGFAAALALVSSLCVVPQSRAQSAAAYVYVQSQGQAGPVYGYSANSVGHLTAIPGSPFKPGTQIVGSNGSQFFTLGHTLLHSYAVGTNGAIGSQLSDAAIMNYSGGSCGGTADGDNGAVLDHTGKYIYVLLQYNADWSCSAYQTYKVNSGGSFTFVGDTEENWGDQSGQVNPAAVDLPSILGNESFGYADVFAGHNNSILGLRRESSGELQLMQFGETDPTLGGSTGNYTPYSPDASPTGNYLVLQLYPYNSNPPQLGSYTVDSQGNISTTNTSSNMPTSQLVGPYSTFSPDGSMFVLYSSEAGPAGTHGNGIEIYNFNGAAPLTLNTTLLNGTPIDRVAWDSSGHLYALSYSESKLWVYSVTSRSSAQDAVISVPSPLGLVVVSKTPASGGGCAAPASNGINVCAPAQGATVSTPVLIDAAATVSEGVYRFEVWWNGEKLVSSESGVIDQTVSLAPGTYTLKFDAYDSSKSTHEYATRTITVK